MTFKPHHDPTHLYFVTATIMGWKRLFIEPAYARIVLDSLEWHRQNDRWSLFVFVVMPNHVHLVVRPLGEQTISTTLQSFGSYTAHVILDQLRKDGKSDLLRFFAQRCDQDITKEHQVWLPIEAKNVYSVRFLRQKVEYIHNNPVDKHWHLVDDRADYPTPAPASMTVGNPRLSKWTISRRGCSKPAPETGAGSLFGLARLREADVALDKVRHCLRLAHRWTWLSTGQYQHASKMVAELGRLLGGWMKQTAGSSRR